jgi:hypothetical protein
VNALCHPRHIYLLLINPILLTDCITVMVRIVQKNMPIFLACVVNAGGPWYLPRLLFLGGWYIRDVRFDSVRLSYAAYMSLGSAVYFLLITSVNKTFLHTIPEH